MDLEVTLDVGSGFEEQRMEFAHPSEHIANFREGFYPSLWENSLVVRSRLLIEVRKSRYTVRRTSQCLLLLVLPGNHSSIRESTITSL